MANALARRLCRISCASDDNDNPQDSVADHTPLPPQETGPCTDDAGDDDSAPTSRARHDAPLQVPSRDLYASVANELLYARCFAASAV
jgi:hypothetical protein